jgi:hypothetical protein
MSDFTSSPPRESPAAIALPPERPNVTDSPLHPTSTRKGSAAVTTVAIVSLVLGAFDLIVGIYVLSTAVHSKPVAFSYELQEALKVVGFVGIFSGLLMAVAGLGVGRRWQWGRILALVLAGLGVVEVLLALARILPLDPLSVVLNAAYSGLVFLVLANRRYIAEFRRGAAETVPEPPSAPWEKWPTILVLVATHAVCILAGFYLTRAIQSRDADSGRTTIDLTPFGKDRSTDNTSGDLSKVFEQSGQFKPIQEQDGMENFPIPYALPPNVQVETDAAVVVKDITATGFKWKCITPSRFGSPAVWHSKGIKATRIKEQ